LSGYREPWTRTRTARSAEGGSVEPRDRKGPPRVFKAHCRTGGAPSQAESGELESQRLRAHPRSKRCPRPWRVRSPCRLSRPMRTGGRWRRTERTMPSAAMAPTRFPSAAGAPTGFILHGGKAENVNPTVLPAHRLAGEPGAPVQFTFREVFTFRGELRERSLFWVLPTG
jgi:hypothetical protein